jgi:transposase
LLAGWLRAEPHKEEEPAVSNRTHVGLDVHKETTAVAVLKPEASITDDRVIATTPEAYRKLVRSLKGTDVVFCYEAGPCGFDPYRMLTGLGVDCDVIAPTSTVPGPPGTPWRNLRTFSPTLWTNSS